MVIVSYSAASDISESERFDLGTLRIHDTDGLTLLCHIGPAGMKHPTQEFSCSKAKPLKDQMVLNRETPRLSVFVAQKICVRPRRQTSPPLQFPARRADVRPIFPETMLNFEGSWRCGNIFFEGGRGRGWSFTHGACPWVGCLTHCKQGSFRESAEASSLMLSVEDSTKEEESRLSKRSPVCGFKDKNGSHTALSLPCSLNLFPHAHLR